jgi:23S rRNA (cytosine1962-C5)-methyltransferase
LIYRKMVERESAPAEVLPGDLVRVVGREGEVVGYGLWNPHSQIALRVLSQGNELPSDAFWKARLAESVRVRTDLLALDASTNAYRLVHSEADGLSGLMVDKLNDVLSVECFSLGMYQRIEAILDALHALAGTRHHRVRVDERVASAERFSGAPFDSRALPPAITIEEHGVRYRVRFEGAHKTGFFCDQRENRARIAAFCKGQSVLDVCCYTGGFGLNARIRGAARDVTCVDLDEKALALARENMNLNQARVSLVHSDSFGYLRQMRSNGNTYGVVALDPPKLISSRDEISLGKRKYYDLNVLAMRVVKPGGILLTCSCSGLLEPEEFLGILRAAAREAGRSARILEVTGAAADHPVALDVPETSYLKACWLLLGANHGVRQEDGQPEPKSTGDSPWPA